ncbi:hypothetical protein GFK04_23245, partial [Salmonella enterica subsp. enterica serovar Enteritidis]|nr:hypothetical protein [Salmonella enterica subsp. enterica serovar Enteritidis]
MIAGSAIYGAFKAKSYFKSKNDEQRKEAQLSGKINQIKRSVTKSTSLSTLNSKMSEISRHKNDISRCNSKKEDI